MKDEVERNKNIFTKELFRKSQLTFDKIFFHLNYMDDPCEIIVKEKILNNICNNITPHINKIEVRNGKGYFICEYSNKVRRKKQFDILDCYKCGQFIGKMHCNKYEYFGNMYNFKSSIYNFGERFCECYQNIRNLLQTHFDFDATIDESFYKYESEIKKIHSERCTFVMLNPNIFNYFFDENDLICGLFSIDNLVLAFPELELLSWKSILKDNFSSFMEGYCRYSEPKLEFSDVSLFIHKVMCLGIMEN